MYKGGPHLVCGDVGISPYRRPSGELDARGSVRVRVGGCDVRRRPEVLLVSCRVVSYRVVSCRIVSCRVVSCRVVSCRVVGGICTGSVTVETVVLLVFITSVTAAEGGVVRPVTSVLQTTQKPELCEFVHESGWGNPDHEVGAIASRLSNWVRIFANATSGDIDIRVSSNQCSS